LLVIEDFSFLLCGECLECVVSHVWKKKKNWVARVIERGRASFNG
jgi:hypothetical protein